MNWTIIILGFTAVAAFMVVLLAAMSRASTGTQEEMEKEE